ncbi:MAG: type VI secretion system tip protein TssI/VgrG, partial [Desulfovibrionaceae bacterium]|nr:type VI secretion system tip protein TssI/VgrG [Desulfovibrionaceae bacterium]
MSDLSQPVFTFRVDGQADDTFDVVRFSGTEGLSRLYAFDVLLVSDKADLDPADILQSTAHLKIMPPFAPAGGLEYTGILSSFEVMHRMGDRYIYQVRLQHKLWWLTLVKSNRVFVEKSPIEACTQILSEADLHASDYKWKCQKSYSKREFICQYDESDFAFLSRWLERLGIYYWFEQTDSGPCCMLSDASMTHTPLPGNETCDFAEPSGLNPENPGLVVTDFRQTCPPLPKEVCFKTYNPQKPDLDLTCTVKVSDKGRGTFYRYGDSYATTSEGEALARVEAESLLAEASVFSGLSHNPALRPGHTFTLRRHFRSAWNQQYLTTEVTHEGSQARLVARALASTGRSASLTDADKLFYRSSFSCIPASTQYRARRTTPWPRLAGSFSAKVDGEGSAATAQLDSQGRYKLVLPF